MNKAKAKKARISKGRRDRAIQHRVNKATARDRARKTTATGLFVALVKELGFTRTGEQHLGCNVFVRGEQAILIDYLPRKGALLIEDGDEGHVIYYDECQLPTATIDYLRRKKAQRKRVDTAMSAAFKQATGE